MTIPSKKQPQKIKPRHYLEWILLKGMLAWIRSGNMEDAYKRVHRLSTPLHHLLKSEWNWANVNLKLIYGPNITPLQQQRLAGMAFENILRSHVDGMRIHDFQFPPLSDPYLHEAFDQGRGVIICGVHLGSWEAGLKKLNEMGFPACVVYRHANNPLSEKIFIKVREPYGIEWIRRNEPRKILKVLKEKKILVLMTDINQREGGIEAPFLGLPAMCPPGAARLAIRFQCPIIPAVCLRESPGKVVFRVAPPIEPPTNKKLADDKNTLISLTTEINQTLEQWIHTYAEQYNWLHARWRSRPDGGTLWRPDDSLESMTQARTSPFAQLSPRVQKLLA